MSSSRVQLAIVGGGVTGLSAAWFAGQPAGPAHPPLTSLVVLEQGTRWGGKILTEQVTGFGAQPFIIEGGPDSFITQKPWAWRLGRQLGLEEQLLPTNDAQRQVYVLHRGRPLPLPDGLLLIVPTRFKPFVLSPLISPLGKLRMGLDLLLPARRDQQDETLAAFIRRRLGQEALDKIAEPLLAGIYNAEAEQQSILATFPRFRTLEAEHGSLIRGMLAARRAAPTPQHTHPAAPTSLFMSFRDGMQTLALALEKALPGDGRLQTGVQRITPVKTGACPQGGYSLTLTSGEQVTADAVILTTPAAISAGLLQEMAPRAADHLRQMRTVSTGTISLAYRRDDVAHPLNGFGVVIPRSERRDINAITWTSTKFDFRAPPGYVLLRVFFGGSRTPHTFGWDDADVVAAVRRELQAILGITARPIFHRLYRWPQANPQYDVGHLERMAAIEQALPAGIALAGSSYYGVGIPDCIHQAEQAVTRLRTQSENNMLEPRRREERKEREKPSRPLRLGGENNMKE